MSAHAAHHRLPGWNPDQILADGCPPCEALSRDIPGALEQIDSATFERAWERARTRARSGLRAMSRAEAPLLDALAAVQRHFAASTATTATAARLGAP